MIHHRKGTGLSSRPRAPISCLPVSTVRPLTAYSRKAAWTLVPPHVVILGRGTPNYHRLLARRLDRHRITSLCHCYLRPWTCRQHSIRTRHLIVISNSHQLPYQTQEVELLNQHKSIVRDSPHVDQTLASPIKWLNRKARGALSNDNHPMSSSLRMNRIMSGRWQYQCEKTNRIVRGHIKNLKWLFLSMRSTRGSWSSQLICPTHETTLRLKSTVEKKSKRFSTSSSIISSLSQIHYVLWMKSWSFLTRECSTQHLKPRQL